MIKVILWLFGAPIAVAAMVIGWASSPETSISLAKDVAAHVRYDK